MCRTLFCSPPSSLLVLTLLFLIALPPSAGALEEPLRERPAASHSHATHIAGFLAFGPPSVQGQASGIAWTSTVGLVFAPVWNALAFLEYSRATIEGHPREFERAFSGQVPIYRKELLAVQTALDPIPDLPYGAYHALLIGNAHYHDLTDVPSAIDDVFALRDVLESEYAFSVTALADATRAEIVRQLASLKHSLGTTDNLLIFYFGHGTFESDSEEDYWIPVDGGDADPTNWVPYSTIATVLRGMDAAHVLIVSDGGVCDAFGLRAPGGGRAKPPEAILETRARLMMTSGCGEAARVSRFAHDFIETLHRNRGVLRAAELYEELRPTVAQEPSQEPTFGAMRQAGDAGGEFLFVRRR